MTEQTQANSEQHPQVRVDYGVRGWGLFEIKALKTRRFLIYPDDKSRQFMCVCAARDSKHAMKIARKNFTLPRTARAVLERL